MANPKIAGIEIRLDELSEAGPLFYGWVTSLIVLILAGLYAWFLQVTNGLVVTGMRDTFTWGLYIQNFIFFVGLSAGGLIIYSSIHLFNAKTFEPISRLSVLQAGVCVLLAMLFVIVDLGMPQRVYRFLLTPNVRSIFVYDATILNLYFILCIIDLWVMITKRGNERLALTMTLISLPAAILLHSITAWVLGFAKARELWHSALMAPLFISSAIASGLGLLILMVLAVQRFTKVQFKDEMYNNLAKLLATVIIIDLFFLFAEIITTVWPASQTPGHFDRLMLLLAGKYAPLFIPEITVFGILPFFLLAIPKTRKSRPIMAVSCGLVVIGIFIKRFILLAMAFGISQIGPLANRYVPTLLELMVTLGWYALGTLIVTLAVKLLPMEVPEEEPEMVEEPGLREAEVLVEPK